jgi:acyl-CoA hydrolase
MHGDNKREERRAEPLTMYELVFPSDLNSHGTMFGGRVMAQMDKCAGMCVRRWGHLTPVTASIDAIQFCTPIHQGQMVETKAEIVFVGKSSCMVKVTVYADDTEVGDKHFCCEGYFTMVGVDKDGKPGLLPIFPVETAEEKAEWEIAAKIKQAMLERRRRAQGK